MGEGTDNKPEIYFLPLDKEFTERNPDGSLPLYCDCGFPECEKCHTIFLIGGGQMFRISNYECSKCGHIWGTDFPDPEALEKGGVFYNQKERQNGTKRNS